MAKVLVEVYYTYGKHDGREIGESYVSDDSKEFRESLYEDWASYAAYVDGSKDDFVEGRINELLIETDGGDWDDPTGREVYITTFERKKDEIERQYQQDLNRPREQFGMEDE